MQFPACSMQFPPYSLKFLSCCTKFLACSRKFLAYFMEVLIIFHEVFIMFIEIPIIFLEVPIMFHEDPFMFPGVTMMFHEVSIILHCQWPNNFQVTSPLYCNNSFSKVSELWPMTLRSFVTNNDIISWLYSRWYSLCLYLLQYYLDWGDIYNLLICLLLTTI